MHTIKGRFISSNRIGRNVHIYWLNQFMVCSPDIQSLKKFNFIFPIPVLTLTYINTTISSTVYLRSEIIIITLSTTHAINTSCRPSHSNPCHPQIIMSSAIPNPYYSQIDWIHYWPFCIICISNSLLNTKYHIIHITPTKRTSSKLILIGLT
jgi:hypothetical protein